MATTMGLSTGMNTTKRQPVPAGLLTACLLISAYLDAAYSFAPPSPGRKSVTLFTRPRQDSGGDLPPWRENQLYWEKREAERKLGKSSSSGNLDANTNPSMQNSAQNMNSNRNNVGNSIGNTFAHIYQKRSTDEFKQPFDESDYDATMNPNFTSSASPPKSAIPPAGHEQQQLPPPTSKRRTPAKIMNNAANMFRHPFQMSSTDEFKRPHGMPDNMVQQQQRPPPKQVFKAPFQTSSTDEFRRSSDVASGMGAPQQPLYQKPQTYQQADQRSESPPWRNHVGQDAFESTQAPNSSTKSPLQSLVEGAANAIQSSQQRRSSSKGFWEADTNINDQRPQLPRATPPLVVSGSAAPVTPEQDLQQWDQKMAQRTKSNSNTMIRNVKWPLVRDPIGVSSEYPLLLTRVLITILATLSTRYMHLFNGYSPVLASSATTLLVSTCFDRRLGQAAFCGSFAGMSGGHLAPTLPLAVMLGALTSASYELLIHINNVCLGVGGRLGATAFLATSVMAKYRGVANVGRKMRRGLWSSAGPSSIAVTMILYHMLGAVATIYLRESSDDSAAADPVRASSVVGLLGSLFFVKDPVAALALYGGSFVGMSLPSRLMYGNAPGNNNARAAAGQPQSALALFGSFAGAGAIAGLIHAMTIHSGYWNGGWGGKAGLCAFAGCWVYRGIANTCRFVEKRAG